MIVTSIRLSRRAPRARPSRCAAPLLAVVALALPATGRAQTTAPAPAAAAALVLMVEGAPMARVPAEAEEGEQVRLAPLDWLPAGTHVATGDADAVEIVLRSGARFRLGPDTAVVVAEDGLQAEHGQPQRLADTAPLPVVPAIAAAPGRTALTAVRIRAGGFPALYPADGARVVADAAELRFIPAVAAGSYSLEIEDVAGRVVLELATSETRVAVPAGVLAAGEAYLWRVRTRDPSGMLLWEEARFETLSAEEEAARRRLEEAVAAAPDAMGYLLLAGVDRGLGLAREAHRDLERALEMDPGAVAIQQIRQRLAAEVGEGD
ncbi:MAG TPA: hypothetical protein VMT16_11615 [Thermoanaerobaculia bacterium]|nr:hypothetical protein [Thermoanaerobaculia bacterium]